MPTRLRRSPQWAASATGRVEPKDGEVRIASQVPGKIVEVLAKTNDQVQGRRSSVCGSTIRTITPRSPPPPPKRACASANATKNRPRAWRLTAATPKTLSPKRSELCLQRVKPSTQRIAHMKTGKGNADAVEAARKTLASRRKR